MAGKFIEGVKPLQQFMEDGSFLMPEIPAVFRALQAMGAPEYVDYDCLLSLSGMAVRLAWLPGWPAHSHQGVFHSGDSLDTVKLALDRAGAKYTVREIADIGLDAAISEIKASIDRGMPVLTRVCGGMAVLGYRDDDLYGVGTFADRKKRVPPHGYNKVEGIKSYILFDAYEPRPVDAPLLLDTLRTAVHLARVTHIDSLGDAALGIASFDAVAEMMVWDESFEPLERGKRCEGELSFPYERPAGYWREDGARTLGERFWAGYCDYLCMLNGYENFARFLETYADLLPEWAGRLKQAAAYYRVACHYSGELWKYVTPNDKGVWKFRKKEVRYAFAAHMLRAKIYTVKAVEILEQVIG